MSGTKALLGMTLMGAVFIAGPAAYADTIVFQDNFGNDVPVNSDGVPATGTGFWSVVPATPIAGGSVTESAGLVTLVAGGPSSTAGQVSAMLRSGAPTDDFNFFTQKLTFSATVGVTTNTANYWDGLLRFVIESQSGTNYSANDALAVRLRRRSTGDEVLLAYKINNSAMSPDQNNASVTFLVGAGGNGVVLSHRVTGFELTLDATDYTLVIHQDGGAADATYTGTHGLLVGDWGTGAGNGGKSSLEIENLRGGTALAGTHFTSTWDNLTVTVPEPATVGLMTLGGLMMVRGRGR
ncbi:MAG: PEP-CTERM sorting domain-containing protein [Phycisphaerales bacterium]